ncbi:uncharacterized protein LOC119917924 [Micropterus salmoides]|uniref:uncharacterized protein LOC119917924 n=1 Tax=Micropterus salmoides TaxID=27706 RepID=UPI0018EB4E3C|nr:uncharacterized protein LOC119917924 [Micropterus salmoides]
MSRAHQVWRNITGNDPEASRMERSILRAKLQMGLPPPVRSKLAEVVPLDTPLHATGLNGQPLAIVTHRTPQLSLLSSGNHHESLAFHLISSPAAPLVLGLPWLSSHNPYIDWSRGKIRNWSTSCHSSCLLSARAPGDPVPPVSPPLPPDLSGVPDVYHDLAPVFSKNLALSLPPHRPYDCSIDLLPDAPLPSSHLYNLSRPERESMEQYIKDSLAAGIIRPSSSPLGAGFFFVAKKDKSLRPCIDYRGLNAITLLSVRGRGGRLGRGRRRLPLPALPKDNKLHPCAFFSRRLTPTERNYTVGDRELLAVKLALEEWRHWLEGAKLPFLVLTDHKNLSYIQTAKRLNSRQARWALFFDRFNFSLSYRPGSRNTKPDALSRLHSPDAPPNSPDTILPRTCLIASIVWEVESAVRRAQSTEPGPGLEPPNRLYVPSSVRSQVLQWAHASRFSCHPGMARLSAPGSLPVKSWILPSCPTSTGLTQTNRGVRLEASVEGGGPCRGGSPAVGECPVSPFPHILVSPVPPLSLCVCALSLPAPEPGWLPTPAPRLPPSPAAAPASHQPHHCQYINPGFPLHPRSIVAALDLVHSPLPPSSASRARSPASSSRRLHDTPPASPLAPRLAPRLRVLTYPPSLQPCALRSSSFSVPRVLVCLSPSFHLPSPRACFFPSINLFFTLSVAFGSVLSPTVTRSSGSTYFVSPNFS